MSEQELTFLQNRVRELTNEVETLRRENTKKKVQIRDLAEKRDQFKTERDDLANSLKEWEGMKDDIDAVVADNDRLNGLIADYEPKLANLPTLEKQLNDLITERDRLGGEVANLQAKVALPPDEANTKLSEYQQKLRRLSHEQAFSKALAKVKDKDGNEYHLHPSADIEEVWRKIDYAPDADDVDGAQIGELVGKALTNAPHLFAPAENGHVGPVGPQAPRVESKPPGPGMSRGKPSQDGGLYTITKEQAADSVFMTQHSDEIAAASRGGTFRIKQ